MKKPRAWWCWDYCYSEAARGEVGEGGCLWNCEEVVLVGLLTCTVLREMMVVVGSVNVWFCLGVGVAEQVGGQVGCCVGGEWLVLLGQ